MAIELRLLSAADAQACKRIRLTALRLAPSAFASNYQTEKANPESFFEERATSRPDNFIVGAFDAHQLIGIGGAYVEPLVKRRHVANVVQMWVEPSHRSQGIARRLMQAVLLEIEKLPDIRFVQLTVTASNAHAVALYEDLGFEAWGKEPSAIMVDGVLYDDLHMAWRHSPNPR